MKKTLLIVALVLAITTSIIAGTMAYYTITLDDLVKGDVVAREFILKSGKTENYEFSEQIEPGQIIKKTFAVKNFDDNAISETGMDLKFEVNVQGGKYSLIQPLKYSILDKSGNELVAPESTKGEGSLNLTFADNFPLENVGQTKTYTLVIEWPGVTENVNDIDYAGSRHGATITVSVTGTQVQPPSGE